MYIPQAFSVSDQDEVNRFIRAHSFGQLISNTKGRITSTSIPFLYSETELKLIGHLARQNPQCRDLDGQEVLITFQGPHEYVSPNWYASPGIPTWNYQEVHVYGRGKLFNDQSSLRTLVEALTEKYEAQSNARWEDKYPEAMLDVIVGIEVDISDIQCKYKLSQNRPAEDQSGVADALERRGAEGLADAMKRNLLKSV